jgi:putative iron-regulated protein
MHLKKYVFLGLVFSLLLLPAPTLARPQQLDAELSQSAMLTYSDIVLASYEDSLLAAQNMALAIENFLAAPSEETFQAAKTAWLAAREPYGQTEAYRFYGGPIDGENGPEGFINAWPLDEAYIDYVEGLPDSGIVNDLQTYPEINAELLESLNEQGAEENISVGFHAIEFLLWGQDLSAEGPGNRPFTDYTTAPNAERRGQYLRLVTELLLQHLDEMVQAWQNDVPGNYREQFLALEPEQGLTAMLTGIGVLSKSELSGERMFTAYDNQDQEDEHSCFSDNTHRDIVANAQGIANVYRGTYTRLDGSTVAGVGLAEVVAAIDPALNEAVLAQLDLSLSLVEAIPAPFDQAIIEAEGRDLVIEAVFALQDQGDLFSEVAVALGLTIDTSLPG